MKTGSIGKVKWELIYGIPYAMSPMPVLEHQQIATAISSESYNAVKKCRKCKVYQPLDYKVSDEIIVQPDILIVCENINKKYLNFPPALIVEILSPSTALKDRYTKFDIYEQQQIKYYLIVSVDKEEAEVYMIENGACRLQQAEKDFSYTFLFEEECKATIDFKEIW